MGISHKKLRKALFPIFLLLYCSTCSPCIAGELDGTLWGVFVPSIKHGREDIDDPMPVTFEDIEHDSVKGEIAGVHVLSTYIDNFEGRITTVKDGYKFKISVPDQNGNGLVYNGNLFPVPKSGYSPKGVFERKAVNVFTSVGGKVLWIISDGVMSTVDGGEIPHTGKKKIRVTGFVVRPKK